MATLKRILFLTLTLGILPGCFPQYRSVVPIREKWNRRIASRAYSFDEAVSEYGPPIAVTPLDSGGRVAEWAWSHGRVARVGAIGNVAFVRSREREETLILTFDDRGVLEHYRWSYR